LKGDINLYRYARNNPLTYIDPEGRNPVAGGAAVGGLIGGPPGAVIGGLIGLGLGIGIAQMISQANSPAAPSSSSRQICKPADKNECEELLQIDTDTCNGIARARGARAGAICHASASQRYAECLRFGLTGVRTPLATWNN
jgi:hypothetical protein